MSGVKFQGSSSGSGNILVTAPVASTDRTVILPDDDGFIANTTMLGMRNRIINGEMIHAQRGTSFPAVINTKYTLDRWAWNTSGTTAGVTISQAIDGPNDEFPYSLRATVTTADAAVAATDASAIYQSVEGWNVRDLIGRTFTLSFWVKSSKTGTHGVVFGNSVVDRSYAVAYTVDLANTWEFKKVRVPGGLITAGTWNWTNGVGIIIRWGVMAGTNFQAPSTDSWTTTNAFSVANQVNCLDTVGNIFAITGVQLEPGNVATQFEHRSVALELILCQRYYERLMFPGIFIHATSSTQYNVPCLWKVTKRAPPTAANLTAITNKGYTTGGASMTPSSIFTGSATEHGCQVIASAAAAFGGFAPVEIEANSEL
jgi:hypothetical protein